MERRALIALALSFVVFMAFIFFGEKLKHPVAPAPQTQTAAPAPAPTPVAARPAPAAPAPVRASTARPAKDVVVDTPLYRAVFTELGGRLKSFQLKKYKGSMPFEPLYNFKLGPVGFEVERYLNPETTKIDLKQLVREGEANELPLTVSWASKALNVGGLGLCEASTSGLSLKDGDKGTLKFTCVSPEGLTFVKTFTFKADSYGFDLALQVTNHTKQAVEGQINLDLSENFAGEEGSRFHFLGFNGSINNKLEDIKSGGLKESKTFTGKVEWAGLDEGYFMTTVIPESGKSWVTLSEPPKAPMVASLRTPVDSLAPGQAAQLSYQLYFGPKNLDDLKPLGLEKAVNFGWFDFLGKPLLTFLNWLNRYTGNYGWAIVILTILLRIVFWYPNHKSYKSMKDMQKLQPKVAKIREKYKDDKEAMNKELMALYKTFKVNPMAGCLPMVLQLPVFIALYNVLGYAIELRHAPFIPTLPFTHIVWLADLSAKDPLLITPLVMGATMFIQQKMTPSAGDPTQAKMMMFLPLIFTFMFLNFASGLVVYWLVNNVLSIGQQYYTNKYLAQVSKEVLMEFLEFEGKTTEDAIENACDHFQVPSEELEIEILSVGSPGIFGLGGKRARIRAAVRVEPEEDLLPRAREILEQVLLKMREPGTVSATQEDDRISLLIATDDAGLLIGKQGQTLDALQYLVTKMLAKQTRKKVRIAIDVEAYRARHNEALTLLAQKYGEKVKRSGKSVTLNPMNPYDRRIVHMALQDDKDLKTISRGEGLYKKVIISPVKKKENQEDRGSRA